MINDNKNRILIVDDEPAIIEEYVRALGGEVVERTNTTQLSELRGELFGANENRKAGTKFLVETCSQGEDAVAAVAESVSGDSKYTIVFLDIDMPPGIDGIETAKRIRSIDANINIVLVTGSGSADPGVLCEQILPFDRLFFFRKPFHASECRQLAIALSGKWWADHALRNANDRLGESVRSRTAELHNLACYDASTQLPNRNKLLHDLSQIIGSEQGGRERLGVILFDIERFGFINGTMGYDFGTALLVEIAKRLRVTLRQQDIAGRFGADEFACIVRGFNNTDELRSIVAGVTASLGRAFNIDGRELFVRCTMGVASFPEHGDDAEQIFRCAEAALNRSKQTISRETVYYDLQMGEIALGKLELEQELRDALSSEQIQPYFQPQICLHSGRILSAEALARWIRPDGEHVPTNEFIPLIEKIGLSDVFFNCMLTQVSRYIADWRLEGFNLSIGINMSAQQMRNPNFAATVGDLLAKAGVSTSMLHLELTESSLLEDFALAKATLFQLHELGVAVEIDDFGTGYSSLSYLAELPVQALKIDRSFVSSMTDSENHRRLVESIVALGHGLGLKVVAEGIETQQQLVQLRKFDCDIAQGYFTGMPMAAGEFLRFVQGSEPQLRAV